MWECGGRGSSSSNSSDDAEEEGGVAGPAGCGSLSLVPAGASSADLLHRGLRGAFLMARRRPELLCVARGAPLRAAPSPQVHLQVLFVAINCWWNQGKCRKKKHFFYFPVTYL